MPGSGFRLPADWDEVYAEAEQLGARFTAKLNACSLDTLHIALARELWKIDTIIEILLRVKLWWPIRNAVGWSLLSRTTTIAVIFCFGLTPAVPAQTPEKKCGLRNGQSEIEQPSLE
jgi:hypothetical protein